MKKYALLTFAAAFGLLSIGVPNTIRQTAHAQDKITKDFVTENATRDFVTANTTRDFVPPTVFQAAGPNVASIQSSVDAFRAELGDPKTATTRGHSQPVAARSIGMEPAELTLLLRLR